MTILVIVPGLPCIMRPRSVRMASQTAAPMDSGPMSAAAVAMGVLYASIDMCNWGDRGFYMNKPWVGPLFCTPVLRPDVRRNPGGGNPGGGSGGR